jgi:hypothetical protein
LSVVLAPGDHRADCRVGWSPLIGSGGAGLPGPGCLGAIVELMMVAMGERVGVGGAAGLVVMVVPLSGGSWRAIGGVAGC